MDIILVIAVRVAMSIVDVVIIECLPSTIFRKTIQVTPVITSNLSFECILSISVSWFIWVGSVISAIVGLVVLAYALMVSISIGSMTSPITTPAVSVVLSFLCRVQLAIEYAIVKVGVFVGIASQIVT
jgi:hypothetical protein